MISQSIDKFCCRKSINCTSQRYVLSHEKVCKEPREVEHKAQIVALRGVGIKTMDTIFLSRASLPFLDELCTQKGIVGEPVIFQTQEDKKAKKSSIVGAGALPGERHLRWIIGALC